MKRSISLIGMAGAGKSSLGKKIASRLDYNFVDSDSIIEAKQNMSLQKVLERNGVDKFKMIEEQVLLSVDFNQTILATGGSAIFSKSAMSYIKQNSSVIYIKTPYEKIVERVSDFSNRGFIKGNNQTVQEAFKEREIIYKDFADHIVENKDELEACMQEIISLI